MHSLPVEQLVAKMEQVFVSENTQAAGDSVAVVETSKKPRGFAAMSKERQKEIASLGGRAAHKKGTAHQFTSESAKAAGKKGGEAARKRNEENAS